MTRECQNCGKDMGREITRRRRFCSDKCRVAFNRAQNTNEQYSIAMNAIYALGKAPTSRKKESIESLRILQKAIHSALHTLGDRETIDRYAMVNQRASGIKDDNRETWKCLNCGQKVFTAPDDETECAFCGDIQWVETTVLVTNSTF